MSWFHAGDWIEDWGGLQALAAQTNGWAHPGMAITRDDHIVTTHPSQPMVLIFTPQGQLLDSWIAPLTEAHGLTISIENGVECLWIADTGEKLHVEHGKVVHLRGTGRVMQFSLAGRLMRELNPPPLSAYESVAYSPTSVALYDDSIWVADGYGLGVVHRYSHAGEYLQTITGDEGSGGRFSTPHAIHVDQRLTEPELLIADRKNRQVQVYSFSGEFKRTFGRDYLQLPSAFAAFGETLAIAELNARVALVDIEDRLLEMLGANEGIRSRPGWPNRMDEGGNTFRPEFERNRFNSPHGIVFDKAGNLYVTEFVLGGRCVKLLVNLATAAQS